MSINLHRIRQKSNEFESFTSFMSVCQMEHMFRKTFEALRTWFNRKYLSVTKTKGHWMNNYRTEHTLFGTQELLAGSPLIPIPRRNVHHQSGVSTYGTDEEKKKLIHTCTGCMFWASEKSMPSLLINLDHVKVIFINIMPWEREWQGKEKLYL